MARRRSNAATIRYLERQAHRLSGLLTAILVQVQLAERRGEASPELVATLRRFVAAYHVARRRRFSPTRALRERVARTLRRS